MSMNLFSFAYVKRMIVPVDRWFDGGSLVRIGQRHGKAHVTH